MVDAQPDLAGPVVVQVGEGHLGGGEQGGREDKAGERVSGRVGDSLRTTHLLGRSSGSSSGGDGGGGGGSSSSSSGGSPTLYSVRMGVRMMSLLMSLNSFQSCGDPKDRVRLTLS